MALFFRVHCLQKSSTGASASRGPLGLGGQAALTLPPSLAQHLLWAPSQGTASRALPAFISKPAPLPPPVCPAVYSCPVLDTRLLAFAHQGSSLAIIGPKIVLPLATSCNQLVLKDRELVFGKQAKDVKVSGVHRIKNLPPGTSKQSPGLELAF